MQVLYLPHTLATLSLSHGLVANTLKLRGVPERDIVIQAATQNDLPVAQAVEEIARLTAAAAAPSSAQNALYMHAIHVSVTIHNLAMRIPHNQQSKLIDFVVRL